MWGFLRTCWQFNFFSFELSRKLEAAWSCAKGTVINLKEIWDIVKKLWREATWRGYCSFYTEEIWLKSSSSKFLNFLKSKKIKFYFQNQNYSLQIQVSAWDFKFLPQNPNSNLKVKNFTSNSSYFNLKT